MLQLLPRKLGTSRKYELLYKNVGDIMYPGHREVLSVFIHIDSVQEFSPTDPCVQSLQSYNPRFG